MKAHVRLGLAELTVDLERPISLAIEVAFTGTEPRHFGAPRASMHPLAVPGFPGSVSAGASCNCSTITLTPHCNGTHTECAGHLTTQPLDAFRVVPPGWVPAALLTVQPESPGDTDETSDPPPRAGDLLVTRRLLEAAWPARSVWGTAARALVIRTLPNPTEKLRRDYTREAAPYLSGEAAHWLAGRGIEHLVVDLPSIDRIHDEGRLTAHRVFFGLPPGARELPLAGRPQCTITELAYVPDSAVDGEYLLELQVPALGGDAVPSRPLLYELERPAS
ncbi:MAG: cyclase family protein [Steroidobacteraceae bacterium]